MVWGWGLLGSGAHTFWACVRARGWGAGPGRTRGRWCAPGAATAVNWWEQASGLRQGAVRGWRLVGRGLGWMWISLFFSLERSRRRFELFFFIRRAVMRGKSACGLVQVKTRHVA
jgi:hypothetical protein